MKSTITSPKLCKAASGWYVHFRINGKQKRFKQNCNRIKDLVAREKEFNVLINVIKTDIKSGFYDDTKSIVENSYSVIDAINFAIEKKKPNLAPKTYVGYKSTLRFVVKAIYALNMEFLIITDLSRKHIKIIFEKITRDRNWSNKSYNKNLGYFQAVLKELIQWDVIESNPCNNIVRLKEEKSTANKAATDSQLQRIKDILSIDHSEFYSYVITIFHTGIRPIELLRIKLGMVDLENQIIKMPAHITKGRVKERIVPLNKYLLSYFKSMELHLYPQDFYLFGSYRTNQIDNIKIKIDFIPGPSMLKNDTPNKRWKRLIINNGINVSLYAMKHTGADKKILAGISLDALRVLYGHQSKLMTKHYARAVNEVYRNEIMDKSPDF
tara:strand:+ start:165 stop:1310 length:1146 start_codon:yes stop_codon:yes gene_type:complete